MDCAILLDEQYHLLKCNKKPLLLEPYHFRLNSRHISVQPIASISHKQALHNATVMAKRRGCNIMAMSLDKKRIISQYNPYTKYCSDGRLYAIATLPHLLDNELKDWRNMNISIAVDDKYMSLAARFIAKEVKWLTLCGNKNKSMQIRDIIYQESGLITAIDEQPPKHSELIIIPPKRKYLPKHNAIIWQNWAHRASSQYDEIIPSHFAEALLTSVTPFDISFEPTLWLRHLANKGKKNELTPIY